MIYCTNVNVDSITLNHVFTVYDALMLEHIFAWQFFILNLNVYSNNYEHHKNSEDNSGVGLFFEWKTYFT